MGATLSSETTAAAVGQVGVVRRDPMAMLPFIGYHAGDYLRHWAEIGKHSADPAKLPMIFQVSWFRRRADGAFLWPGYGENSRVLKWVVQRLEGSIDAVDTPVGLVPRPEDIDTDGLALPPDDLADALRVDVEEWTAEIPDIAAWFVRFGAKLPAILSSELDVLQARLIIR